MEQLVLGGSIAKAFGISSSLTNLKRFPFLDRFEANYFFGCVGAVYAHAGSLLPAGGFSGPKLGSVMLPIQAKPGRFSALHNCRTVSSWW